MEQQQVYELGAWNLQELVPQGIEPAVKEIEQSTQSFESKKSQLTKTITSEQYLQLLKEYEDILVKASKIAGFAHLRFSEDSSNHEASALKSKTDELATKTENRLLFFPLWFQKLPTQKAKELANASGQYKYYCEQLRKLKKYTLKENEEKLISLKRLTGVTALRTVYDIITTQLLFDIQGQKVPRSEIFFKFIRSPDPKIREEAYKAFFTVYKNHQDVLGELYRNIVKDWHEENIGVRKYKTPIQTRNIANDIPEKAVEALLSTCEKNFTLFQKFFELKKKKLGLNEMRRFDIYAPVQATQEKEISYAESVKLVLETFEQFSPAFKEHALKIINGNHIHSTVQKNKDQGAFCSAPTKTAAPFVLLNYTNNLQSTRTLAHELGHGVHFSLASKQTELTFNASLPLAETASVFAETLLFEKLLERFPEQKEELLYSKLDDMYATIMRQAGFVMFEKKAHQLLQEGKTVLEMNEEYIKELKTQFGPSMNIDPLFAHEWIGIPHIYHTPFYCYAYAFGNLLVLSLYELYKEQGQSFVPKVVELLEKGGSQSPEEMTKAIGVNINSEKFWQKGFTVAEELLKKLENGNH